MDIRLIRHFIAIAESGTLTAAARRLDLAQSAVSQSLARLEAELGVRLFSRSRRGAELTPAGRVFLEDAMEGVRLIDAATARAIQGARGLAGKITIGFSTAATYGALPEVLRLLRTELPEVEVALREMKSIEQADALRNNEIDLGFNLFPIADSRRINQYVVSECELIAAVPPHFSVTADARVSISELAQMDLITFRSDEMPDLRNWVSQAYQRAGCEMRVAMETGRVMTALSCVAAGYGVTMAPSFILGVPFPGVRYLRISEADAPPRVTMRILWRAGSRPEPTDQVVALLRARRGA